MAGEMAKPEGGPPPARGNPSVSPPRVDRPAGGTAGFTFAEHVEELRRRLGISLAALLAAIGVSVTQVERIVSWLQRPARHLLPRFAFFTPTEPIIAYAKVAVLSGLILAMPVILLQLWAFIRPGLTPSERSYGIWFVWWASLHFLAGVAFSYAVLLPASLTFLLGIGAGRLEPVISIDRYLSFATTLSFWCGVIFEMPVVIVLLAKIGIVTPTWLRQQRPYAVLVLTIIAAIVTPTTDMVSLLLVTVPMIVLYELSILMASFAHKCRSRHSASRNVSNSP